MFFWCCLHRRVPKDRHRRRSALPYTHGDEHRYHNDCSSVCLDCCLGMEAGKSSAAMAKVSVIDALETGDDVGAGWDVCLWE